jgi:hypothetical protein
VRLLLAAVYRVLLQLAALSTAFRTYAVRLKNNRLLLKQAKPFLNYRSVKLLPQPLDRLH